MSRSISYDGYLRCDCDLVALMFLWLVWVGWVANLVALAGLF